MTELLLDVFKDTLLDTLKVLPFLFIAYLLIEVLEQKAEEKTVEVIHRAGPLGPVLGGLIGVIPQCGFSAATSNLYAGGIITRGTMIAVFLSTSDEMLPIFLSHNVAVGTIVRILLYKVAAAMLAGLAVDLGITKLLGRYQRHIHDICEQDDCHCEEGNIWKSALIHTGKILGFLFITSFVIGLAVEMIGPERLSGFILNQPVIGEVLAGVIGLIPNCAASVIITRLYLQGVMSGGAMMSGLLVGAGVGILVLFRMNRDVKDNLISVGLLYVFGVIFGILAGVLGIF